MEHVDDVMAALKEKGSPQRTKVYSNHGAPSDKMYGVKVADLKVIARAIKGRQELAYELYDTGNVLLTAPTGQCKTPRTQTQKIGVIRAL